MPPRRSTEHKIQQVIYFRVGYLESLWYPQEMKKLFKFRDLKGYSLWEELCDSDPVIIYKYLKLLSQYGTTEPATLPPKKPIKSWNDMEDFVSQADVGYYLSRFGPANTLDHPLTLQQLQKLLDRFLSFLTLKTSKGSPRGSHKHKDETRKVVRSAVKRKWDKLEKEGVVKRIYGDFTPTISEIQKENYQEIELALTNTLIKEEVATFAKKKKFIAKRGPSKKNKSPK